MFNVTTKGRENILGSTRKSMKMTEIILAAACGVTTGLYLYELVVKIHCTIIVPTTCKFVLFIQLIQEFAFMRVDSTGRDSFNKPGN